MTDLYLVAHKAHGVATFDVAIRQPCGICQYEYDEIYKHMVRPVGTVSQEDCDECDGLGYWWITSTGGWRVYPWWSVPISSLSSIELVDGPQGLQPIYEHVEHAISNIPEGSRELYNPAARDQEPSKPSSLALSLGLIKPAETIKRRI